MIRSISFGLVAVSLSASVHALTIEAYEEYLSQRAGGSSVYKDVPPLMVQSYFAGVAEVLAFLHKTGGGKVMLGDKSIICLPPGNQISGELLTAVATAELKDYREHYVTSYGAGWQRLAVSTVFVTGLARMFPC